MSKDYTKRIFMFNGIVLDDPDEKQEPKDVADFYSTFYPALTNAAPKGPTIKDGIASWTFKTNTGTKG